MKKSLFVLSGLLAAGLASAQTVIYANAVGGDHYALPTTSVPLAGAPGWGYTNIRSNSTIGINTDYAQSGNGSVSFSLQDGNGKADIEYYNTSGRDYVSMGRLDELSALSYDWYRAAGGTAENRLSPAMRLLFDADGDFGTTTDRGYLIYEEVYNTPGARPVDQWVTSDVLSGNVWQRRFSPGKTYTKYDLTIADWANGASYEDSLDLTNAAIYGLSMGIGSGWNGT
ncbi:hypothetical protein EON79_10590, partial [bacterium]